MTRKLERHLIVLHLLLDVALTLVALRLAEWLRQHILIGIEQRTGPIVLDGQTYAVAAIVYTFVFQVLPVLTSKRTTTVIQEFRGIFKAVVVCVLAMASLFYLLNIPPSRLFFLYFFLLDLGLLMGAHSLIRALQRYARRHGFDTRNVLLVGAGPAGQAVVRSLAEHEWSGLRLVGIVDDERPDAGCPVPYLGKIDQLPALLASGPIDEVIIALPATSHATLVDLSHQLQRFPVMIRVAPDILDVFLLRSTISDLWGLPLLSVREPAITGVRWMLKRVLDVVMSLLLLVILSPILLVVSALILITSGRPIILRQQRVGEHGCMFSMLKFRTMTMTHAASTPGAHKSEGDVRVTPVGAYLRRLSLDELPQLFNVVRGEMSLVGPRPELPWVVDKYEPWQHARHVVPPGMTGWWQINGRSELPLHLNTQLDLFYIQNFSVFLDLRILARTFSAVIRGRGAF